MSKIICVIVEVVSADPSFPVPPLEQMAVIDQTLGSLGARSTRRVRVWSQWDRVPAGTALPTDGVFVSRDSKTGLERLLDLLANTLAPFVREETVRVAWHDQEVWKVIWREFVVKGRSDGPEGADLRVRGTERAFHLLAEARKKGQPQASLKDGTIV